MTDIAEFDIRPTQLLRRAEFPRAFIQDGSAIIARVPFRAYRLDGALVADPDLPPRLHDLRIEALANGALRLSIAFGPASDTEDALGVPPRESAMLSPSGIPAAVALRAEKPDADGSVRLTVAADGPEGGRRTVARFPSRRPPDRSWSELQPPASDDFRLELFPPADSSLSAAACRFASWDQFFPGKVESVALGYLEAEREGGADDRAIVGSLFSFGADAGERFAGTGERFGRLDLSGRTVVLENTDALGVNSRRAYKNVPFWLSSRGYGVFVHDSARMVFSFADVSTRAAQATVASAGLDLFVMAGSPEGVLRQYREISGFPPELPLWSYGVWVAKMTYFSEEEVASVVDRLRAEDFPFDLIHLDTGWFAKDWVCEWRFSKERFPDPARFLRKLREQGVRVSLWQTPNIGEGNILLDEARDKSYIAPVRGERLTTASDFSGQDFGGQIDFSNPAAETWYRSLLRNLFELGAAAIKTDFGEKIAMNADYFSMDARRLRNLYALLYQRAAFEETKAAPGTGIVWARAGWAGCQRYPLHWGGDAAATWDGLAGSIRGGLQLGMSGFAYWASDVGGFHGLPEFMNDGPSDSLYLRWTQAMVFASHFRYHGTSDREPYAYPAVADEVRAWLRLRYALIPYLMKTAADCARSGFPVMRPLALSYPKEPEAWTIDDEYLCGADILAAPILNEAGVRSVYLPEGTWVDFWTGDLVEGRRRYGERTWPSGRIPLYLRFGAEIPYYPDRVACTDRMTQGRNAVLSVDSSYRGIAETELGRLCGLR